MKSVSSREVLKMTFPLLVAWFAWVLCLVTVFVVGDRVCKEGLRASWGVLPMGVFSVVYIQLLPLCVFVWHLFG